MRTSLDIIPEAPKTPLPLPENEKDVENKCNYERYRSIVEGQVKKGSSPPPLPVSAPTMWLFLTMSVAESDIVRLACEKKVASQDLSITPTEQAMLNQQIKEEE